MPRRILAALICAPLVLLLTAGPAWAHTKLDSSDPTDASVVAELDELTLTFTTEVELLPDAVTVDGYDGDVTVERSADGTQVLAGLEPPLGSGSWTIRWRILAIDSHPREGALTVQVASPSGQEDGQTATPAPTPSPTEDAPDEGGTDAASEQDDPPVAAEDGPTDDRTQVDDEGDGSTSPWEWAADLARVLMYLGLMTAAGLTLFQAGPHRGETARARRLASRAAHAAQLALVGSFGDVALHVAAVSGAGLAGMLDGQVWAAVMRTGLGTAVVLRTVGLALMAFGGHRRSRLSLAAGPDALKLAGVLFALGSFQFVGHTASTMPEVVVRIADGVHAVAAAVWIGGLAGLALLVDTADDTARRRTLARFSTAATLAVVGVAAAGSTLALVTLPGPAALVETRYGLLLLGKLVVVAVLGAIGAHNHFHVVPLIVDGEDAVAAAASDRLRQTVRLEVLLMTVVLALTAVLVVSSPL